MQAGLVAKQLTLRDVFTAVGTLLSFLTVLIRVSWRRQALIARLSDPQEQFPMEAPRISEEECETDSRGDSGTARVLYHCHAW